jgi:hypothetical protein
LWWLPADSDPPILRIEDSLFPSRGASESDYGEHQLNTTETHSGILPIRSAYHRESDGNEDENGMQILIRGNCGSSQGWTHNHQLGGADT